MCIKCDVNLLLNNDALKYCSFKAMKFFDLQKSNEMNRNKGEEYA